jgi:NADPH-dependent 2,4-dienoyl-CoA reductase/sulfur reductase-like enzyme
MPARAAAQKKVVVVGGGPAGMEAASVAASRGHAVVLFEKTDRLGGNLLASSGPSFKDDWKLFLQYLLRQVEKSGADVRLGTEATTEAVAAEHPDEIVVAVGAEPIWPEVPGSRGTNVVWTGDVMGGLEIAGDTVVVVGTGGMGKEAALHLAQQGKKVRVVELHGGSGADPTANFINVIVLDDYLEEAGVEVDAGLTLLEVTSGDVVVRDQEGRDRNLPAEAVVMAPPLAPRAELAVDFSGLAEEVHLVGDCRGPRILFNAIHEGFEAALEI